MYLLQGNLPAAIDHCERAMAYGRERQILVWAILASMMLGYARVLSGDVEGGMALLEQSAAEASQYHRLPMHWLAAAYRLAGRLADATDWATRALAITRESGERGLEAWALHGLGDLGAHGAAPAVEEAERYYHEALALATELGMRPLAAHCHLGLGTLYQKLGHDEEAEVELATACELYRAMEMTFWLETAEAALAGVGSA